MCTSLGYRDEAGRAYFGRTLELSTDLPYQVAYFPVGHEAASAVSGHPALTFRARHGCLAVAMPGRVPTAAAPLGIDDLNVMEGLNDAGLTFSLLSYPAAGGQQARVDATRAVLSAADLGLWALGGFASVDEVKAALAAQPVMLQPLAALGGVEAPFHYVMHDASGASAVIEFHRGAMTVYDNPVGVMTNGPRFDWHLTNLDNYTFLSNVDRSTATFGAYRAVQPDSGIATAGLPASNTSVGRFVRAAYFATFAEAAETQDAAVQALAHIMNNFDRPRGATIDYPEKGGETLEVAGLTGAGPAGYETEFTCWTSLADLERRLFFIRDNRSLNFLRFDLTALAGARDPSAVPLATLTAAMTDASAALAGSRAGAA